VIQRQVGSAAFVPADLHLSKVINQLFRFSTYVLCSFAREYRGRFLSIFSSLKSAGDSFCAFASPWVQNDPDNVHRISKSERQTCFSTLMPAYACRYEALGIHILGSCFPASLSEPFRIAETIAVPDGGNIRGTT
jgi:hypothetical protein